jgi:hypothetical protein
MDRIGIPVSVAMGLLLYWQGATIVAIQQLPCSSQLAARDEVVADDTRQGGGRRDTTKRYQEIGDEDVPVVSSIF